MRAIDACDRAPSRSLMVSLLAPFFNDHEVHAEVCRAPVGHFEEEVPRLERAPQRGGVDFGGAVRVCHTPTTGHSREVPKHELGSTHLKGVGRTLQGGLRWGVTMGAAGQSAAEEAQRLHAHADEYTRLAAMARAQAERFMVAHATERQVAGSLSPLTAAGYTFLHDRRWPGSRTAQIDHVVVGPGGLFVVDTKSWAEVEIAGGRIWRGQEDVTGSLDNLASVGDGAEEALAEVGLAPGEVRVVVVLANRAMEPTQVGTVTVVGEKQAAKFVNSRGVRLTPTQVDQVLSVALSHFPAVSHTQVTLDPSVPPPVMAEAPPEPLLTVEDVSDVLLAGLLAAPIEEWMAFLHPEQAKLVRRTFSGPARIRGAAGTGKTVVGLHRAAYIARGSGSSVLVTTFVKTLPVVLSTLLERLAPEVSGRVEFSSVHGFALRLLKSRGIPVRINQPAATRAFDTAWRAHGANSTLAAAEPDNRYWSDELSKVIKGRGLTRFEQYAELARTGRRRPLGVEQRRSVWRLFCAYEANLHASGVDDFDDVILKAEASLRANPDNSYAAVIIDEAQDLSCAMVRMLHLLVGDRADGLTLIGDGQQSIYPGGFTLSEARVSIAGRGVVMNTNYRNTREIFEFAGTLVEKDEFADLEGSVQVGDSVTEKVRSGPSPVSLQFSGRGDHDRALIEHLRSLETPIGDVGVLCLETYKVNEIAAALRGAGIPYISLDDYKGRPINALKLGTVKRAKGLEFKQVAIGRVKPSLLRASASTDEVEALQRRELYVAMTRARDGLWVGACA